MFHWLQSNLNIYCVGIHFMTQMCCILAKRADGHSFKYFSHYKYYEMNISFCGFDVSLFWDIFCVALVGLILITWTRQVCNVQYSSCLSLPCAGIAGVHPMPAWAWLLYNCTVSPFHQRPWLPSPLFSDQRTSKEIFYEKIKLTDYCYSFGIIKVITMLIPSIVNQAYSRWFIFTNLC